MTLLATQSFLTANLGALGQRNQELAEAIRSVQPHPGLVFSETSQGVPAGALDGRQLCSRHRPLDEADRMMREIDLVEHAVVVVFGFGLGYHVQKLVERSERATLIIVFEPDLPLLRSVFERVDHSSWLRDALVLFVTSADDRGMLARKLEGAESILAQGVEFFDHPPSRARLGEDRAKFASNFRDAIAAAKTTLTTTLMRSADTVRNLLLNIDHYAAGPGIAELRNAAAGFPAVVVSAGPSLHKNIAQLAKPGVRDRCIIVAVQTTLKPLLAAGIKPHFVTALDYHEISGRFYEDLDPDALRDVTLIADPKAHPVILDSYPGPVRCCANPFLDKLLGPLQRDMGTLPAGATVAHLAMYVARHLGCNPIAMIGQDLGFSDGLYYAPGAVIHDTWAPELNPFNTIAMMEWQRIARHRLHLHKTVDVHGRSIYIDLQMHTYLQQFERDFARYRLEGVTIIDATEGGVAKQHTTAMRLDEFLRQHAVRTAPRLPVPTRELDTQRLRAARRRIAEFRGDVVALRDLSKKTSQVIRTMLEHQRDQARMAKLFTTVESCRAEVAKRQTAFDLINQLNQLGVFRRMRADRRLHMLTAMKSLDPLSRQRFQLERDRDNVEWTADAAEELLDQLALSQKLLAGERVQPRAKPIAVEMQADQQGDAGVASPPIRVAALVPIDPHRNGFGVQRSLAEPFNGRPVLQATLERLGRSTTLESIILLTPAGFDVESLIDRSRIGLPVEIDVVDGSSPFEAEHEAIGIARLWADTCWRGGIAGISAYDEALCPQAMHQVMQKRGLTAALIVGPDWPLIDVTSAHGCDAIVNRHREHPERHNLVFTQTPPGLGCCLISASLMAELAQRNRLSTVGGLLVYQPHAPQHDPIARDANVQVDHRVRRSLVRATFDTPRQHDLLHRALQSIPNLDAADSPTIVQAIEAVQNSPAVASSGSCEPGELCVTALPQHVVLELCADRVSCGWFAQQCAADPPRPPMTLDLAQRIVEELAAAEVGDIALTLAGAGDPLLHPQFDAIIRFAKQAGIRGVHVRTELLCDQATIDRLLAAGADVVSVDLNADRATTYQAMMGVDRFRDVLINIEYLLERRQKLTPQTGTSAMALPWLVPRLLRCDTTYEDIDTFFERWQHTLGTAVIDDMPPPRGVELNDSEAGTQGIPPLTPAVTPMRVIHRDMRRCLVIRSDGSVPVDIDNHNGSPLVGRILEISVKHAWNLVRAERERMIHAAAVIQTNEA